MLHAMINALIFLIFTSSNSFCANEAQDMEKVIYQELQNIREQERKRYEDPDDNVEEQRQQEESTKAPEEVTSKSYAS